MCSAKGGFGAVFQLPPDPEDYPMIRAVLAALLSRSGV